MKPAITPQLNDPVTQHMHRDFTRLREDQTVQQALTDLRETPPQERIIYFYVVNSEEQLLGVVPTRRSLLVSPEQLIADIMVRNVVTVSAEATVLDACEFFVQYRFLALPVVDSERRILGVIDVELYTTEIDAIDQAEKRDELFQTI